MFEICKNITHKNSHQLHFKGRKNICYVVSVIRCDSAIQTLSARGSPQWYQSRGFHKP